MPGHPVRRYRASGPERLAVVPGSVEPRLATALVDAGHTVRAMTRHPDDYDGAGSPVEDFTAGELKILNGNSQDSWETISLYQASGTTVLPLEKHAVERGAWYVPYDGEMPSFGSLGGMFSATAQQIFGEVTEAGKVMGLAPYGEKQFATSDFFDIDKGRFCFKDAVPLRFRH